VNEQIRILARRVNMQGVPLGRIRPARRWRRPARLASTWWMSPPTSPPVCKIMDFFQFKYSRKKRASKQKHTRVRSRDPGPPEDRRPRHRGQGPSGPARFPRAQQCPRQSPLPRLASWRAHARRPQVMNEVLPGALRGRGDSRETPRWKTADDGDRRPRGSDAEGARSLCPPEFLTMRSSPPGPRRAARVSAVLARRPARMELALGRPSIAKLSCARPISRATSARSRHPASPSALRRESTMGPRLKRHKGMEAVQGVRANGKSIATSAAGRRT